MPARFKLAMEESPASFPTTSPITPRWPLSEEEENTLGDILEDTRERGPMELTDQHLLREEIRKVLGQLTLRERQVIELRFGLIDDHDHTLEEVGKKLKVTRERVRQIEERAIRKLRHPQASRILKDYLD